MIKLSFWLIWFFIFLVPWENVLLLPGIGTAAKIAGLVVATLILIVFAVKGSLRWHVFHTVGLVFVLWSWSSLYWSFSPEATFVRALTYTQLWVAAWLVYQFADTDAHRLRLMLAYVLGAWVAALFTVYSSAQGIEVVYHRYAAPGFDPNDLSFYLNLGIPFACYVLFRAKHPVVKLISIGYIPVAITAVLLTSSRAGILGCIVAMACMLVILLHLDRKWRLVGVALLMVGALLVIDNVPSESYSRIITVGSELQGGTLNERTTIWRVGFDVYKGSPLVGAGAGAFAYAVEPYHGVKKAPHNVFLSIAVEGGLIGLLLWLGLMGCAFWRALQLASLERVMWLAIMGVLLLAFFSLNFEWRKVPWLLMGLAAAAGVVQPSFTNDRVGYRYSVEE